MIISNTTHQHTRLNIGKQRAVGYIYCNEAAERGDPAVQVQAALEPLRARDGVGSIMYCVDGWGWIGAHIDGQAERENSTKKAINGGKSGCETRLVVQHVRIEQNKIWG